MPDLDLSQFDVLTFDCYGTLIDWESGILAALHRAMPGVEASDETLLEAFGRPEAALEAGPPGDPGRGVGAPPGGPSGRGPPCRTARSSSRRCAGSPRSRARRPMTP